jgi:hypothetical protein
MRAGESSQGQTSKYQSAKETFAITHSVIESTKSKGKRRRRHHKRRKMPGLKILS